MKQSYKAAIILGLVALILPLQTAASFASAVSDIQDQLNSFSSNLDSMLYQLNRQRELLGEFDGYIADLAPCLVDHPDNQSCKDRMADLQYQRNTVILNAINEVNGYITRDNARLNDLRAQLAAEQKKAADAAAAAIAAPENKLSEKEISKGVETAKEISKSLDQSIQQDSYFSTSTVTRIAETEKTLATLNQNSEAYANLVKAKSVYEETLKTVNARLEENAVLKKQQVEMIAMLQGVQEKTKFINIEDSKNAIAAAAEIQKVLTDQVASIGVNISDINAKISDLANLLKRLTPDSPEYSTLLATKTDLENALTAVVASQAEAEAQVKATEQATEVAQVAQDKVVAAEEIRVETLPQRVQQVFAGQEITDGKKQIVPIFKAKKLNTKYAEITTKPIPKADAPTNDTTSSDPQIDMTAVQKEELKGAKITLLLGKKVFTAVGVTLKDDGTISMKIPNELKAGTYTLKIDLPDTKDDPSLKVKISRS